MIQHWRDFADVASVYFDYVEFFGIQVLYYDSWAIILRHVDRDEVFETVEFRNYEGWISSWREKSAPVVLSFGLGKLQMLVIQRLDAEVFGVGLIVRNYDEKVPQVINMHPHVLDPRQQ